MKKNRVFVGPHSTAANAKYIAMALRTVGIYAKSYTYTNHQFGYRADYNGLLEKPEWLGCAARIVYNKFTSNILSLMIRSVVFLITILRYDIIFYISPLTIFVNHIDLIILKKLRKKIVFLFPGCQERDPLDKINSQKNSLCSLCTDYKKQEGCLCTKRESKKNRIRYLEKYADIIFAQPDTIGFLVDKSKVRKLFLTAPVPQKQFNLHYSQIPHTKPPRHQETKSWVYMTKIIKLFSSISYRFSKSNKNNLCGFVSSCERIIQVKKDENLIRISHFPSNTILKGTRYVLSAKDIINRENVVFNIERLSNDEVLNRLNETHILVNQFGSGYGLLAVEAMARGCVIVSRIADWFNNEYPEHPVLHCEAEELVSVLDDLINNPAKIIEIGKKSIAYYNKFHSPEAVGNYYKRVLNLN